MSVRKRGRKGLETGKWVFGVQAGLGSPWQAWYGPERVYGEGGGGCREPYDEGGRLGRVVFVTLAFLIEERCFGFVWRCWRRVSSC